MTQTLKTSERLGVVDALRGFALLAIVLLHNLEHYNLFLVPENVPAWLQTIDKYAWDILFFLFAGKAYATFSLLFGFSFYIQFHNAEKRGIDFRGRFAWRMCLLFLFAQLHASMMMPIPSPQLMLTKMMSFSPLTHPCICSP